MAHRVMFYTELIINLFGTLLVFQNNEEFYWLWNKSQRIQILINLMIWGQEKGRFKNGNVNRYSLQILCIEKYFILWEPCTTSFINDQLRENIKLKQLFCQMQITITFIIVIIVFHLQHLKYMQYIYIYVKYIIGTYN